MPLHRLAQIEIGVPEDRLEATRAFYCELGLAEKEPGRFSTEEGGEQLVLAVAPRRTLRAIRVGVDDAEDLRRIAASLAQLGFPAKLGSAALQTCEPATQIRVELLVEARLVQAASAERPTNGPGRTIRRDARAEAAVTQPQRPRPHRLSHVVTASPDAAASRRFFVEGLGFRVSDEVPAIGAAFLRCSSDHHNLLVQPGPFAFLHHTAWEMRDVDAVGLAAGAMIAADPTRHAWGLGRHGIGSNYFWYLRDPAGNFAEFTSDLDVIEDEGAWKRASAAAADGLAAWGPPVPREFIAPDDIVAIVRGEAR